MSDPGDETRSRTDGCDGAVRRRNQTLVDALDDGVYRLDADGRFVAVNDAIVETTGYARDELLGEHLSLVADETDVDRLERERRTRLERGVDDDTAFDLTIETAGGDRLTREVRFNLVFEDGDFAGTAGTVREIDTGDRRRDDLEAAQERQHGHLEAARETDEAITSVIDEADVAVFVLDESFDVAWVNETTETYFGVDQSELVGQDKRTVVDELLRDRLEDPEAFAETVLATYEDNTYVEQFECRIESGPDREERWLEHRSSPIESGRYADGRIELYYDVTERNESRRARLENEQRFHSLVDAVEEYAIFMLDPEGRIISWNGGAERIKGYEAPEIIGEHFSVFYTDDDRANDVPERNLAQAYETGAVEDEGWRVRADGTQFWANVTITAVRDEGELQGYAKVTRDMTDRRARERQLRRERDLTEQILETSPVGIAVVEPDGTTSRANDRMAVLLDLSETDMAAYTAGQRKMYDADGELLPIEDRPASRAFQTGEPLYDREILLNPPHGRQRWLSMNATPITGEQEEPERVVMTATDITDLKELIERRKQELEEREKELAAVQLATSLLETGDQPVDELLQEFVANLPRAFPNPEHTAARVSVGDYEAATDDYEPTGRQITVSTSTARGTQITIDVVFLETPHENDAERLVSEERELIETLATLVSFHFERQEYIDDLHAETRRLEQFAYAASHDLQEPLRMVSSYLQLIEQRYGDDLDEDGHEFLEFAVDGAERMREMIQGLLAYSRVETRGDPFDPVDLDAVLEDVLSNLELRIEESDAEIAAEPLPEVEGDASQLRQVFQNLLDNAIEYSRGVPRIEISAERAGDRWTVAVRDHGIGIDPDETDRIFEIFQRLHSRDEHAGTGIGLAVCRRIVERHGGEIAVDSTPGEGSTFTFTLPAA